MNRVLIIEDEHALAAALATVVRRLGADPLVAASGESGLEKWQKSKPSLVILDVGLPDMSGLQVLETVKSAGDLPPVFVITAHGTLDTALEAKKLGVIEYFLKPLNLTDIKASLTTHLANEPKRHEIARSASPKVATTSLMLGKSPPMQHAFAVIAQACDSSLPVLITGGSGTGKSLAADTIHAQGQHAHKPLLRFSAEDWEPEEGLQSLQKLLRDHAEGTLVIEEVSALSRTAQSALIDSLALAPHLRLIATSRFTVEYLASSLRGPLFYHLKTLHFHLPALTERIEDLPLLTTHLLSGAEPSQNHEISPELLACLKGYSWPGNVRELASAIHHAVAKCPSGKLLPHHLPSPLHPSASTEGKSRLELAISKSIHEWLDHIFTSSEETWPDYDRLLLHLERDLLQFLLHRFDDKPTHIASALNMNRATLRRKLRELQISGH